jgi:hypothetical protein
MQGLPQPFPFPVEPGQDGIDDTEYLTLGGRIWPLRLDMATCARFERATGVNMLKNWSVLRLTNQSMTSMLCLLWSAMSQVEPSLTLDAVGQMIKPKDFEAIGTAINHMITKGIPPEEDAPAEPTDEEKKSEV